MSGPPLYERLPGRGFRSRGCLLLAVAHHTLWLGDDHLLSVDGWGYTEDYRRFAYSEIHSISARLSSRFLVTNLVLLLLLAGLVAGSFAGGEVLAVTLRILAALLAPPLLLNLALGPTCRVTLRTAVRAEELPAWSRTRTFRRGMERLRPRILAAQGSEPSEPSEAPAPAPPVAAP